MGGKTGKRGQGGAERKKRDISDLSKRETVTGRGGGLRKKSGTIKRRRKQGGHDTRVFWGGGDLSVGMKKGNKDADIDIKANEGKGGGKRRGVKKASGNKPFSPSITQSRIRTRGGIPNKQSVENLQRSSPQ